MSQPVVWLVVLNWNGLPDTMECLRSLRALRYARCRIIVVDNGSTDGSAAALRIAAADGSFELVEAGANLGYAGGNNLGIRRALEGGADFVLVLNNDTIADPDLLDELVGAAARFPDAGCFGPWIYYLDDPERLWFTRSEWGSKGATFNAPGKGRLAAELSKEVTSTQYVCGAALFFRAEVANRIGLFDERFFLVYEDSDWCFRARRAGFECLVVPTARVWHKVGMSFGSESSPLRTYFSVRNKLLWAEKNLSRSEWLAMVFRSIRRLFPRLVVERGGGRSLLSAVRWGVREFVIDARRKFCNPQELARRRALFDYSARRFGNCPEPIRVSSEAWSCARVQGPSG